MRLLAWNPRLDPRRAILPLLCLLLQCAFLPAAQAAPAPLRAQGSTPDDRFGIVDAYQYPDARAASGAKWERVNFWWNEIQPDSADEHFAPKTISDAQLQTELSAGMTVVGLLGNPPEWATRNGSTPANLYEPIDDPSNYWAGFVRYMVATYGNRIHQWIIWNEPDIPQGMEGSTWAGTVDEYYQLVKVASEVAKSIDPSAQIVVAGTTYWVDITRNQPLFIDRFAAVAAADPTAAANNYYFDAVDLHVYSRASDVLRIAQAYRAALQSHGIDKPLWLSEANAAPYDDPATPRSPDLMHVTMQQQANFIIEAFAYALAANIQRISVYRIADPQNDPTGPWGLLHTDGTPRPAFQAYKTAVHYFSGAQDIKFQEQNGLAVLNYTQGANKIWLFWADGQQPMPASAPLLGNQAVTVDKLGNTKALSLPTTGAQPTIQVVAPGAIMPGDDGGPLNSRVGGDPVFVVESGIGQGIVQPDGSQFFPQTGVTVAPPFLAYFVAHGGTTQLGQPTAAPRALGDGSQSQQFAQGKLRTHPQFAGSDYFMEAAMNGADFASGANYTPFKPVPAPAAASGALYFPQTGHTVSGAFRRFFESHGDITIFGYPRTEAFTQNGRQVQWFQRAMFEYHPEFAGTPYEVELRLLGSEMTASRDFAPAPTAALTPAPTATPKPGATKSPGLASPSPTATPKPKTNPNVVFFPQTDHTVSFAFLHYFQTHGGLDVFGYPISQELPERGVDGRMGTVQYFQRARFEYHSEFAGTPYEVELGLLGDQYLGL